MSMMEAVESAAKDFGVTYVLLTPNGFIKTRSRPANRNYIRVSCNEAWLEGVLPDRINRILIWKGVN
jgi:hypothetical protein